MHSSSVLSRNFYEFSAPMATEIPLSFLINNFQLKVLSRHCWNFANRASRAKSIFNVSSALPEWQKGLKFMFPEGMKSYRKRL